MLNIYELTGEGSYSGAHAVVAANNIDEAISLANESVGAHQDILFTRDEDKTIYQNNNKELTDVQYSGGENSGVVIAYYEWAE